MKSYLHFLIAVTFLVLFPTVFAQVNLDSGLVAFLPLNGNTVDVSGNGHDGTINGNAVLTTDRFNVNDRAFTFPDQTSNVSLANTTDMNLDSGFTINAWVKYKDIYAVIVAKHICGYVNGFVLGIDYDGQIQLWLGNSTWSTVRTNLSFIENKWYMVTGVYDFNNGTAEIYIDGQLEGSENLSYTNFSTYPITIGEVFQNNCSPANMSGAVDEVKIYNRVLSNVEIETEYSISRSGIVAFYPFNGNANDESGNLNNGVNHNASFAMDRYGNDNSAIYFDGVDSYVEGINPGNNLPTGSTPRTICAWIKSIEASNSRNIFHYGTAEAAPTNYHLFMQEGKFAGVGNGYGFGILISDKDIGDATWHFVTGVYEGTTTNLQRIYIDGKFDVSEVISSVPNTVLGTNWRIGRFMGGSPSFHGNIDEVIVHTLALSEQEIWDLYLATTTAPTLLYPNNNSTINTLTPLLDWDSLATAINYQLLFGTDSAFNNVILSETVAQSNFQIANGLLTTNTDYYWKVRTINDGGIGPWSEVFNFDVNLSGVEDEGQLPTEFALMQNYPNPFNPSTRIQYQVAIASQVTLKVYDVLGNEVATLVDEYKPAGIYEVEFNTSSGISNLVSGIYFYQLLVSALQSKDGKAGEYIQTKKMLLLK